MIDQVIEAVREAGDLSLQAFGGIRRADVGFKGDVDLVTQMDRTVENLLRKRLAAVRPRAAFVGEETSDGTVIESDHCFVVDPIDGTTNFVHAHPFYAVSVAYRREGRTLLGVVYAPALQELYVAQAGEGAEKDGRPLHVSQTDTLIEALAATGFACVRQRVTPNNLPLFQRAVYATRGVRRAGSAAIDLCYLAEGRLDLYWEYNLRPWDFAAGMLIVREAGGRVTDFDGSGTTADMEKNRQILATNGKLHTPFLNLIASIEKNGDEAP